MYNTQQIISVYPKCEIMYVTCFGHFSIALALRSITIERVIKKRSKKLIPKEKQISLKALPFQEQ